MLFPKRIYICFFPLSPYQSRLFRQAIPTPDVRFTRLIYFNCDEMRALLTLNAPGDTGPPLQIRREKVEFPPKINCVSLSLSLSLSLCIHLSESLHQM